MKLTKIFAIVAVAEWMQYSMKYSPNTHADLVLPLVATIALVMITIFGEDIVVGNKK